MTEASDLSKALSDYRDAKEALFEATDTLFHAIMEAEDADHALARQALQRAHELFDGNPSARAYATLNAAMALYQSTHP